MALSYDPLTGITTGFLGGEVDFEGCGPIAKLLDQLKKVAACAIQPMLLPIIAYSIWCDIFRIHIRDAATDIILIQRRTGLMEGYMQYNQSSTQPEMVKANPGEHKSIHEDLVQTHASLTNDLSRFVEDFGKGCEHAIDLFRQITEKLVSESALQRLRGNGNSPIATVSLATDLIHETNISNAALRSYLDHWLLTARVALQQRDQQLDRANMQLQVVRHMRSTPTGWLLSVTQSTRKR